MSTSHMWLTTPPFASAPWVGPLGEGSEREEFLPLLSWPAVLLCGSGQGPGGDVGRVQVSANVLKTRVYALCVYMCTQASTNHSNRK